MHRDGGGCGDHLQSKFLQRKLAAFGEVGDEFELLARLHRVGFEFVVQAERQVFHDDDDGAVEMQVDAGHGHVE